MFPNTALIDGEMGDTSIREGLALPPSLPINRIVGTASNGVSTDFSNLLIFQWGERRFTISLFTLLTSCIISMEFV